MTRTDAFRATQFFVLMHSGIVNEHQLMCDAHTLLEPHRGTTAFFYSLSSFSTFSFFVFVTVLKAPLNPTELKLGILFIREESYWGSAKGYEGGTWKDRD